MKAREIRPARFIVPPEERKRQKEQFFSNLAEAMQGVPERIQARQLVHLHKADPAYGRGVAKQLGLDMEKYVPWTRLSLKELAEKTAE